MWDIFIKIVFKTGAFWIKKSWENFRRNSVDGTRIAIEKEWYHRITGNLPPLEFVDEFVESLQISKKRRRRKFWQIVEKFRKFW